MRGTLRWFRCAPFASAETLAAAVAEVLSGVDIEIEHGNPKAIGAYGRAAQGTSIQDVTIRCADCAVGIQGGAGSGGSHINVRVEGGKIGLDLSQSQPSPTVTGVTLLNQTQSAIVYGIPGRQTLSVTGARIRLAAGATGPAIQVTAQALSLVDSVIEGHPSQTGIAVSAQSNIFMQGVWFKGLGTSVVLPNGQVLTPEESPASPAGSSNSAWSVAKLVAAGRANVTTQPLCVCHTPPCKCEGCWDPECHKGPVPYTSPVFKDGVMTEGYEIDFVQPSNGAAPSPQLTSQHVWASSFPSWFDGAACRAKTYGAKGDLNTDDTAALQAMLDDPKCSTLATLDKGYYAVSKTLQMRPGQALLGVSRIYSNIVPHASVPHTIEPGSKPMPLLQTSSGATDSATIGMLSVMVWRHINSSFAVSFQAGKTLWRRAHTNRVDLRCVVVDRPPTHPPTLSSLPACLLFNNQYC